MYKNIKKSTKLELKDLVAYQEGQVVDPCAERSG